MHRQHCRHRRWVFRDPAHLQEALFTLPLFDPRHMESLYDVRHDRRQRVPCPQQGALVAALADALWTAQQQRIAQTRQATALEQQLTRLITALAAVQETSRLRSTRLSHARLLQRTHDALMALRTVDLHALVSPGPPTPDTSLLLALYRAFVDYGPPLRAYPRDAIYMALAVLWQALDLGPPASQPSPLSTLAVRLGRRIRRYAGPASSAPAG